MLFRSISGISIVADSGITRNEVNDNDGGEDVATQSTEQKLYDLLVDGCLSFRFQVRESSADASDAIH